MKREDQFVPEPERFEFSENPIHKFELARRDFFHLLGAGIAIFTSATHTFAGQETAPQSKGFHPEELPTNISAWLHISEDGTVTGFTGKAEIGQNIRTSLAQTIADELRATEPNRTAEFVIAPGLQAQGDPRLMRVVLENLLRNAWKFTSKRNSARIEFGRTADNGHSAFFVKDNGAGFDPNYSSRLFGAFQRLHSASEFPGTGVGLATVQRIILRHGGKVWAQGDINLGATFFFEL